MATLHQCNVDTTCSYTQQLQQPMTCVAPPTPVLACMPVALLRTLIEAWNIDSTSLTLILGIPHA